MKKIVTACVLMVVNFTLAQTSVVQDAKGETSLPMGKQGVVAINSKDESISFSYGIYLDKPDTITTSPITRYNYGGIAVKGKGKNGLINIVKNDDFQYDGSIGLFFFQDNIVSDNTTVQWYGSADFLFSQFKLYDSSPEISFDKQVYDENSKGFKLAAGTNIYGALGTCVPYVLGIQVNGGQKNNTGGLKQIEISEIEMQTDPLTGQIRYIEKNQQNAYSFADYSDSLWYSNFNVDLGPQLFTQYLLLVHSRWSVMEGRKPQWNPAIGLYFTKTGAPKEIVAGIQVQTLDWSNSAMSEKSRGERTVFNIVAGYSF